MVRHLNRLPVTFHQSFKSIQNPMTTFLSIQALQRSVLTNPYSLSHSASPMLCRHPPYTLKPLPEPTGKCRHFTGQAKSFPNQFPSQFSSFLLTEEALSTESIPLRCLVGEIQDGDTFWLKYLSDMLLCLHTCLDPSMCLKIHSNQCDCRCECRNYDVD